MADKNPDLEKMRHSCSHLLAAAVLKLYPNTKLGIGPVIENGFYYDFEFKKPITEQDLTKVEEEMQKMKKNWQVFERIEMSIEEAKQKMQDEPYKLDLLNEFEKETKKITFYKSGEFIDLCKGPHVEKASEIGPFKLLSIAGAYWKGSEKNKMLTRIYGTCFETKEELEKYLWQLKEAKKRDHRKLGKELGIFIISEEVGQGLILWLPKGTIIKEELEKWGKKTEEEWGYQRVVTPNITKSGLYYTSGHLPYYKEDMYPPMTVNKNEEYYLKPMNCPHHHMIYKSGQRSYKDLPLRLAEYGTCYRYEASGQLYGLMRVRGFTQNDAHIYTTLEQAVDEFVAVMKLHEYYYQALGIKKYYLELGLRDPKNKKKYHGDEEMWKLAEKLMREAVAKTKIKMVEVEDNAAFYGPKIDFIIHSTIGREFAISTNQIDLYMGPRFNLKYIDQNGKEQTPVIIHRAPLGSDERFVGFLIEHYAGAFPLWLSPVQIVLFPIADRHVKHAEKLNKEFKAHGIRSMVDSRQETLQAKIREATLQKVPYMGIIGDKEIADSDNPISIRTRDGKDLGRIKLSQLLKDLKEEIDKKI